MSEVKQLSERGVLRVIEGQNGVVLQIIRPKEIMVKQSEEFLRLEVSDGFAAIKSIVYGNAVKKLKQLVEERGPVLDNIIIELVASEYAK
jgi:hypothetical protein